LPPIGSRPKTEKGNAVADRSRSVSPSSSPEVQGSIPILAQINEHVFKLFGADMREAYTNPRRFVEMNTAVFRYYKLDLPGFYYDLYNIEAEALGQKMNWDAQRMPDIDRLNPLVREPADLDRLRPPDCGKSGRMPFVLEIMKRSYDLGYPVRVRFCSPFSLAVNVRGIENFLMDIMTAPRFAHRLLAFLTDEVLCPWIQAQREAIGKPEAFGNGADAAASPPIVTIEIFEEFVVPYVLRMNERIKNVTSVGYWGYSHLFAKPEKFRRMLSGMATMSPALLMALDPDVDRTGPEPYVEFARERAMPLMLGLDTNLLQAGPIEKIVERCRRYVLAGARAPRLTIFFNDVSIHTPPEHTHAAISAIRHFGSNPAEALSLESFRMPVVEPFAAFLRRTGAQRQ
jgi:uroporphyrinogen-III decarboxylase